MDQVTAYELNPDSVHYTTKFLDGLKPVVHILVAIQQPRDLDTTYSLALLYEDLGEECGHYQQVQSTPYTSTGKPYRPPIQPSPPPPPPPQKWVSQKVEENRKAANSRSTSKEKWQSFGRPLE